MTTEQFVAAALGALVANRHTRSEAVELVPKEPGLYAFYGRAPAWSELGLVPGFDGQPLYVGKAERSLNGRDVGTHFSVGKTGSSTVRRSLAALLAGDLALVAVPRNLLKPDGSAHFGLDARSEERLSGWMEERLLLSTWTKPEGAVLDDIETAVVRRLRPPLNLAKVGEPRTQLREARKRLADTARSWRPASAQAGPPVTFEPPGAPGLSGEEPFEGLDASVIDFWRFAMNDLRTNNVRGYLAEFLVARAVGSRDSRVEWDPWDVTSPDGTRIEVKSAGFLQAWFQKKLSTPTFRVAAAYGWDAATGAWSKEQSFNADVYVFCLHTAKTHDEYDPLAVSQWQFYVADKATIETRAGASMGLSALALIAGDPVPYSNLRGAIATAASASQRS